MSELQLQQPITLSAWYALWPELETRVKHQLESLPSFDRLVHDSRKVRSGDVFFALTGTLQQGQAFITSALQQGAQLAVCEGELQLQQQSEGWVLHLPNLRSKLGELLLKSSGLPLQKIRTQAVTGTNGKSSVAHYLSQAWQLLGQPCALVGTLGYGLLDQLQPASHTTPDMFRMHQLYADWLQLGIHRVALEASSHALEQGRLDGINIPCGIFTNLTRDHLDYHGTLEAYAAAKLRLFQRPEAEIAILNLDDPLTPYWLKQCTAPVRLTYSLYRADADLSVQQVSYTSTGIQAQLMYQQQLWSLQLNLLGAFNLANVLAVLAALLAEGWSMQQLLPIVAQLKPVPGRMQRIEANSSQPQVVVDYAHTPDALEQALKALREHTSGRLWCVFGCGGNRDQGKRALMGEVAVLLADQVVVTDDNPRDESPVLIRSQILAAATGAAEVADRASAIQQVVNSAAAGDVILLAGKGHETWQKVAGQRIPFDDVEQARIALQRRIAE
ncbi:MAG: UDP-N-acetylmuramoyl-L-alanyl-D-glutamate--2,6-diaminopimelate ligase [Marinospirillum sp.]|uniref:UDP-N-acetylmuramoyl-L-alanyl-D-glutamate--2, 6-diaminopimelate ligase n=1 Tax=Marinospirillum sp. TaxID=2183934 RepID=UPI0019E14D8B|nr:UDP-N-acetylmuramoyl-L-alanyl-D-glutamate--2,6-diaminopimelate ligase [Marinospirillum sp.]MBE0505364.1 UDP-N-acetylmuramoyl-L-alanyl-D-glutamate--2,6-diaminopimelate ligase [Marinospirillum sp.]